MNVVHLITDLDVGGSELMLYKLVSQLAPPPRPLVVSMRYPGRVGEMMEAAGVTVHSLDMDRGASSLLGIARLVRLLRRERPAILQTWLYHADLLGLVCGWLAGVPHVVWNVRCSNVRLEEYRPTTRLVRGACALLSRRPSCVVVNASSGRDFHIEAGYHPRAWRVIPNGFDLARFRPDPAVRRATRSRLGLADDALAIGMVARVDPMKDHRTFLRAAAILKRRHSKVHFLLAGRGSSATEGVVGRLIKEASLAGSITVLDEVADVASLYPALDVCSLTSYGEGFPNVLGEAMACGVPCVSTAVGDAAYIVGDTGAIVPVADPEALADAWTRLVELGPAGRRELGNRARERVASQFSIAAVAQEYAELYAQLAGESQVRTAAPEAGSEGEEKLSGGQP